MKTKNECGVVSLVFSCKKLQGYLTLGLLVCSVHAGAADAPDAAVSLPPPAPPLAVEQIPAPAPQTVSGLSSFTKNEGVRAGVVAGDVSRTIGGAEDRAADNARSVVKHLDNSSDATTMEDLNSARQAVARLDAMIEVEKHLIELEKIRGDHGGSKRALEGAIPASALTPPPPKPLAMPQMDMVEAVKLKPARPPVGEVDVQRIYGVEGKYTAVVKTSGSTRTLHVGDTLSEGVSVRSITPSAVTVDDKGAVRSFHVKNVDTVYSAMR